MSAPVRFLVMPVARLADLPRRVLARLFMRLGDPTVERAGVSNPGRRICFAHPFEPEHLEDLREMAEAEGATLAQIMRDEFPSNWRFPTPTVEAPQASRAGTRSGVPVPNAAERREREAGGIIVGSKIIRFADFREEAQ